jgi:hypothetical protein
MANVQIASSVSLVSIPILARSPLLTILSGVLIQLQCNNENSYLDPKYRLFLDVLDAANEKRRLGPFMTLTASSWHVPGIIEV